MMKNLILAIFILLAGASGSMAQDILHGRVTDALNDKPLAGASIVNAAGTGAVTDADGRFSIACTPHSYITVTYVGYQPLRRFIRDCSVEVILALSPSESYLEDIEITATSSQNKSLLYQPASITKLNQTELKRGNGLFLDDAINGNVPGVSMQRRTVAAGQQFNIRGYGNGARGTRGVSSNFDGQGYKVYLNGIPITDAEGITQMDDIDFGSIGNVEIIKGPSGTLFGMAISGVVNLHIREPEKGKTAVGQDLMFGSYGLQRFTTHFETAGENGTLLVNYGYQHSDGFMAHTESTKKFFNAAARFQISPDESLSFYAGRSNSYDERGGELTLDQYANFDYSGNPEYIKRNAHSEIISARGGISHTYQFTPNISNTSSIFVTGMTTNSSSAGGWTDKNPFNYGFRSTFDIKLPVKEGMLLSSITGVEMQTQRAQTLGYTMVRNPNDSAAYWIVGSMRSNQYTKTFNSSLFTEWTLSLTGDLSITAGLGLSSMNIDLKDRFYSSSSSPFPYQNSFNGMLSPRVAVNKVFNKHASVYVSYSKGYRAPVSSYFFIPTTGELNTGLKPEIGNQFEIGSKGVVMENRLAYELAAFEAIFSNKMTAVAVPLNSTTTAYSYVANGGKQEDRGVEGTIRFSAYQSAGGFLRLLRPFGNFTWSHFKYLDFKFEKLNNPPTSTTVTDYSGKEVAGVPKFTGNLGVDVWTHPGLYANVTYLYKDGFPITSDNTYYTTAYNLLNAKLGFQQTYANHYGIEAYFGVTNITGTQYPFMVFVNQLPDAYLPAPYKANYFGGVNLKYIF